MGNLIFPGDHNSLLAYTPMIDYLLDLPRRLKRKVLPIQLLEDGPWWSPLLLQNNPINKMNYIFSVFYSWKNLSLFHKKKRIQNINVQSRLNISWWLDIYEIRPMSNDWRSKVYSHILSVTWLITKSRWIFYLQNKT